MIQVRKVSCNEFKYLAILLLFNCFSGNVSFIFLEMQTHFFETSNAPGFEFTKALTKSEAEFKIVGNYCY